MRGAEGRVDRHEKAEPPDSVVGVLFLDLNLAASHRQQSPTAVASPDTAGVRCLSSTI
jgi:hypothetical protein